VFITHTTDLQSVPFKQIHQLLQCRDIHQRMVCLANRLADDFIEHPSRNPAPGAVGQSRDEHVGPAFNNFQGGATRIE
jgi:hypothetical protein